MNRTVPLKPFQPVGSALPTKRKHRRVYSDPEQGRRARLAALARARMRRCSVPKVKPVSSDDLAVASATAIDDAADLVSKLMSRTGTGHRALGRLVGRSMEQTLHRLYAGGDVKLSTLAEIVRALGGKLRLEVER